MFDSRWAWQADNSLCSSRSCGKFYDIVCKWRLNWRKAACLSWAELPGLPELAVHMNKLVGMCPLEKPISFNYVDTHSLNETASIRPNTLDEIGNENDLQVCSIYFTDGGTKEKGIVKSRTQASTTIDNVCDICACVCIYICIYKRFRQGVGQPTSCLRHYLKLKQDLLSAVCRTTRQQIYDILKSSRHFSKTPPVPAPCWH